MSKRSNELYAGVENVTKDGVNLKHPSKILHYASVNSDKVSDIPITICGLDLETDYKTGELKLLGFYKNRKTYSWHTDNFIKVIYQYIKWASRNKVSLAYWNRLDPFVILKQFLIHMEENEAEKRLERFGKVAGEWNRKTQKWDIEPVVEVKTTMGARFGIVQAIRSSVQFFYMTKDDLYPRKVWAFDIAQLFMNRLEVEAKRFDWYSKLGEEFHKVDWERFENDKEYKKGVLLSNELDARACTELAYTIQEDFKTAFKWYPRTLISQGSLARSAIVAQLKNIFDEHIEVEDLLKMKVHDEVCSIGFMNYYDEWSNRFGEDTLKDLYCLATEAYSGGCIESVRYGYAKEGCYADIASAYPSYIVDLYDLRNAEVIKGKGPPPTPNAGYVFIRGTVNIPEHVNYHPITVKHITSEETNVRPVGKFRASYIKEERDFVKSIGGTFEDEEWYLLETEGKLSSLARVCKEFISLRKKLKEQKSSSEYMAKITASSLYGILYEAVETHEEHQEEKSIILEEDKDTFYRDILGRYRNSICFDGYEKDLKYAFDIDYPKTRTLWHNPKGMAPDVIAMEIQEQGIHLQSDNPVDIIIEIDSLYRMPTRQTLEKSIVVDGVRRVGHRAGEFWNPIYASIITAKTRVMLTKASTEIEKRGGKPIILMTDSITWEGTQDMLPKNMWREEKTLGYFEKPEKVQDIVCLGTGRYGYKKWDEERKGYVSVVAKRRGLNATDLHDSRGIPIEGEFSWLKALDIMKEAKSLTIPITVRALVTAGMVLNQRKWRIEDLGRIVEEKRYVKAIVGLNKRIASRDIYNINTLTTSLVDTRSIIYRDNLLLDSDVVDSTYPDLRNEVMQREVLTKKEKRKKTTRKATKKYEDKNRPLISRKWKQKYHYFKSLGYNSTEASRYAGWSDARIKAFLAEEGII